MKTTDITNYTVLLEVYRIGLANAILDKQELVRWADNIIQHDDQPDIYVIELSLCGNKSVNDTITLLNEIIGDHRPQISGRVILGLLYNGYVSGKVPLKSVAGSMNWIVWHGQITDEEKRFMYAVEEMYYLAANNMFGSVESVEKDILRFIEIYRDFSMDNFEHWNEIDKDIDGKVKRLSELVEEENKARMINKKQKPKRKWWAFWKARASA